LTTLTPADLLRWFNLKTFGEEDPPDNANPTESRSSTIANWKKQISYFMPNNHHPWNEITNVWWKKSCKAIYRTRARSCKTQIHQTQDSLGPDKSTYQEGANLSTSM